MIDLYPTPTRLDLLAAVALGRVWQSFEGDQPVIREDENGQRKVTAQIDDMSRAGWVRLPGGRSVFALTDAGLVVLDAGRKS